MKGEGRDVKTISSKKRNRLALFYAILAAASLLAGIVTAAASQSSRYSWILALAGLVGYVLNARFAMRLWQGDRTFPRSPHSSRRALATGVLVFAAAASTARGQQTAFNVPTADVLERGKVYLEVDHLYRPSDPYFQAFTLRGVTGVGGNVEVGLNFGGFVDPGRSVPTVSPNIKWQPYSSEGLTVTTGALGLFYLRGSADGDSAALAYGHGAYRLSTKTRLTAGGWVASSGYVGGDSERAVSSSSSNPSRTA